MKLCGFLWLASAWCCSKKSHLKRGLAKSQQANVNQVHLKPNKTISLAINIWYWLETDLWIKISSSLFKLVSENLTDVCCKYSLCNPLKQLVVSNCQLRRSAGNRISGPCQLLSGLARAERSHYSTTGISRGLTAAVNRSCTDIATQASDCRTASMQLLWTLPHWQQKILENNKNAKIIWKNFEENHWWQP